MNRRTFLGTGVLAAAAANAAPKACGLGISTYGLQSFDLAAALQFVAETGYDCVEITAFEGFTGDPLKVARNSGRVCGRC